MSAGETVISKNSPGWYSIVTRASSDPLSALVVHDVAMTLWGARRVAKRQRRRLANHKNYREVIPAENRPLNLGLIKMKKG